MLRSQTMHRFCFSSTEKYIVRTFGINFVCVCSVLMAPTCRLLQAHGIILLKYSIKRIKQYKCNTFWKLQGWN